MAGNGKRRLFLTSRGSLKDDMHNFEKLKVYQKAVDVTDWLYEITKKYPKEEMFLMVNQMRRATISIVLNIAEGSGRSKKEFSHFLNMSRTSAYECTALLQLSVRRGYITREEQIHGYEQLLIIIKMINKLKSSLK